jgi:hypothetical protein
MVQNEQSMVENCADGQGIKNYKFPGQVVIVDAVTVHQLDNVN